MKKKPPLSEKDVNRYFRANTGIVILNSKGLVMAFERIDHPGAWQFPQGGIDPEEDPAETAKRELKEETNIVAETQLRFIGMLPEWVGYELPVPWRTTRTGRGQVQKWFFYQVLDDHLEVDLESVVEKEFIAWKWMTMEALIEMVIEFRQPVYRRLDQWLKQRLQTPSGQ